MQHFVACCDQRNHPGHLMFGDALLHGAGNSGERISTPGWSRNKKQSETRKYWCTEGNGRQGCSLSVHTRCIRPERNSPGKADLVPVSWKPRTRPPESDLHPTGKARIPTARTHGWFQSPFWMLTAGWLPKQTTVSLSSLLAVAGHWQVAMAIPAITTRTEPISERPSTVTALSSFRRVQTLRLLSSQQSRPG